MGVSTTSSDMTSSKAKRPSLEERYGVLSVSSRDQVSGGGLGQTANMERFHHTFLTGEGTFLMREGRVSLTPERASFILRNCNYDRQRDIYKSHIERLSFEMQKGLWIPGSQISFGVMPDGKLHLVNGQHRLRAVMLSGMTVEFQILLVPVKNAEELHELYCRHDTVQRARSNSMVVRSSGLAEDLGIQKKVALSAYTAGVIIAIGMEVPNVGNIPPHLGTPNGRLEAIRPWWTQVKMYNDIILSCEQDIKKRMTNPSVMAVALVTLAHQKDKAIEFWSGVADNSDLRKGDPRRALIMALLTKNFSGSVVAIMRITCSAWNHWFEGTEVQNLRPAHSTFVLGTPFQKRGE